MSGLKDGSIRVGTSRSVVLQLVSALWVKITNCLSASQACYSVKHGETLILSMNRHKIDALLMAWENMAKVS